MYLDRFYNTYNSTPKISWKLNDKVDIINTKPSKKGRTSLRDNKQNLSLVVFAKKVESPVVLTLTEIQREKLCFGRMLVQRGEKPLC
jgi:hypothetical protein